MLYARIRWKLKKLLREKRKRVRSALERNRMFALRRLISCVTLILKQSISFADATLKLLPELTVLVRVRGGSKSERAALERRRAFDRAVTELIVQAQRDGDVRAGLDAHLITRLIFGMSNSVVEWYRSGSLSRDTVAGTIVGLAFEGMIRPPTGR